MNVVLQFTFAKRGAHLAYICRYMHIEDKEGIHTQGAKYT